ncbi:MAG: hypothetical protein AAGF60_05025 [Pseudomonadota bacterium]
MSDHADQPKDPVDFNGDVPPPERPAPIDLRGEAMARKDKSTHRRHHWLYEDLLN